MSRRKGATGTGLQIALEFQRSLSAGERDDGDQFPRTVLGCVWTTAGIVINKSLFHVLGETNVVLIVAGQTAYGVNVIHSAGVPAVA
jgi:hypothetical protein